MTQMMSKMDEAKLVDSVIAAIKQASAGMDPTDAIIKVATDCGYNKDYTARMVEAFNVSKAIKHRKEARGDQRADAFPIADVDKVMAAMWPDNVATPAEQKSASWEPSGTNMSDERHFDVEHAPKLDTGSIGNTWDSQDIDILMKRACNHLYKMEHDLEEARFQVANAKEGLVGAISKLASYFRNMTHEPFDSVEAASLQYWGNDVKPLFDMVWDSSNRKAFHEKRASGPSKVCYKDATPYVLTEQAIDAKNNYSEWSQKFAAMKEMTDDYRDKLGLRMRVLSKYAAVGGGFFPLLAGAAINEASKKGLISKSTDERQSMENQALPPDYEAERRAIIAQTMMHDFMTRDPVLSKANPKDLVSAYNDVVSMAPRIAEQPAAMRGVLRKAIESGSLDPYELSNLINMEVGMKRHQEVERPEGAKSPEPRA
jgi:hypothetical protein